MSSTRSYYFRGFRDGAPFVLVVVPFALLFGFYPQSPEFEQQ